MDKLKPCLSADARRIIYTTIAWPWSTAPYVARKSKCRVGAPEWMSKQKSSYGGTAGRRRDGKRGVPMAMIEKGQHLFFQIKNGRTIPDKNQNPRYCMNRENA